MRKILLSSIGETCSASVCRTTYKQFRWITASAVAALGIMGMIATAQAQTAVQQAESGGIFTMPAGDFSGTADSAAGVLREGPRLNPTPAAELRRIKALAGRSGEASDSVDSDAPAAQAAGARAVLISCAMNVGQGNAPSDVHGAVAPTNIVEVTNVHIMVRNKTTCALVSSLTLKSFFNGFAIPAAETLFDPRVLYDRLAGRCIVTAESRNSGNTDQFLYIASSRSSSCTTWRQVRFVLSRVSPAGLFCKQAAANFYDYPNAGYNNRRLVVTANHFTSSTGSFLQSSVLSIDKVALHGTATVFAKCFRGGTLPSNMTPAVVGDFSTAMFILSPGSGGGNSLRRIRLNSAGAVGTDTLTNTPNIAIGAWTAPPDAAQPNGQRLDTLDGRFQSATKQIGTLLWNVHAVNSGGFSRWRLYRLSTTATAPSFVFTPFTTTCTNQHLFNPSVDTNSTATTALAFVTASRTCLTNVAASRAAHLIFRGANASTAGWVFNTVATSLGQFSNDGFGFSCNTTSRGSCRWGDYSSTQIDPSSTATAWGFNQLITTGTLGGAGSQFNWTTRGGRVN